MRRVVLVGALLCASTTVRAETVVVTVDKLAFSPAAVSAKTGDTVRWVNKDPLAHTATVKGGWDVPIGPNGSASRTMDSAGEFAYFCRFHPNMTGRITVAPR